MIISLLLHGLVAAGLLTRVDWHLPDLRQEQTVDVVLVPEPEPAPEPEEQTLPPEPEPEPLPKPALEPQEAEEEAAPPPAPEPAPQAEPAQPLPVLQPVYEYADKDNGSEKAQDGAEAPDKQEAEAAQALDQQAEPQGEETAAETPDLTRSPAETETAGTEDVPEAIEEAQETGEAAPGLEASREAEIMPAGPEPSETDPNDFGTVGPIASLSAPPPKPAKPKGVPDGQPGRMIKARQIYSDALAQDPLAWTAMAGLSRDERASMLCMTELRDQLRRASPPWSPEVLPRLHLGTGTVMQTDRAAFFSAGQWYDLAIRCEVNSRVTRVVSFAYRVGAAVPRNEWRKRRFPEL